MRRDAITLEEERLNGIGSIEEYEHVHERHRIFPAVFEERNHKRVLDISAGMGIVGKNISDNYETELVCNDISPTCINSLKNLGLSTVSFDIDDVDQFYQFTDGHFDAIISLATIEHLMNVEHFLKECRRILSKDGYLYLSAPNYSGITYLLPFLITGKTFHDPLDDVSKYEFYAHVRYFTYRTLVGLVSEYGFAPDAVYLAIPEGSTRYLSLKSSSRVKAFIFRNAMKTIYKCLSPRWASEPVICFRKYEGRPPYKVRKVVL